MIAGPTDNNHGFAIEPRLPDAWARYQTPDNSLWGDAGWRAANPDYQTPAAMGRWLRRNPAQGLDIEIGARIGGPDADTVQRYGDPQVQDAPEGVAGVCRVVIGPYWNYVRVMRAPWILRGLCLKINLGWELKTYAEDFSRLKTQPIARYAASIRPARFKTSKG